MKYFHRHAGAKFFMPDGREICFAGGEFDSESLSSKEDKFAVERELAKIANVPSSMIYTKEVVQDTSEKAVQQELRDTAVQGFDVVNKIPAGTSTVPMPTQKDPRPTLNNVTGAPGSASDPQPSASGATSLMEKAEVARKAIAAAAEKKNGGGAATGVANTSTPPAGTVQ